MGEENNTLLNQVMDLVKQGKGREEIKTITGLSMWKTRQLIDQTRILLNGGTILPTSMAATEQVKLDRQIAKLKDEKTSAEAKYAALLDEIEQKEETMSKLLDISEAVSHADPRPLAVVDSGQPSQSTAFMVASDWHIEETVDPATVEGVNEYNLDIAGKRAGNFFRNGLKLVDMCRTRSTIDTVVLPLLGDIITGYIHEELVEENSLSPVQAVRQAYELIASGIDFLLEQGGFRRIIIPCTVGNHGRTTQKPRVATAVQNSYEWLLYSFIALRYQDNQTIQMKIADGYLCCLDVYDFRVRLHHGNGIKYQGGVGGVHIPLHKAIAQWNKMKHADVDVLGHWHNRMANRGYVVNGSLIGYSAYAIQIKAEYEPPQQAFFLMHPKRGKTVEAPIHVDQ
jgi:hypothetical protein